MNAPTNAKPGRDASRRGALRIFVVFAALLCASGRALPGAAAGLEIGDAAPEFALQGSDGKLHRLSEYRGQAVVLAWFPKAFTGG